MCKESTYIRILKESSETYTVLCACKLGVLSKIIILNFIVLYITLHAYYILLCEGYQH